MTVRAILLVALAVFAASCVQLPHPDTESAACRRLYADVSERIDQAGVTDGGAHRLRDYPYLRSDRFLASFDDAPRHDARWRAWLDYARRLDQDARAAELSNAGIPSTERAALLARLEGCGDELRDAEAIAPAQRAAILRQAQVPDDYSQLARAFGLYPLAVPFLNRGIASYQAELRADYERDLTPPPAPARLILWRAATTAPVDERAARLAERRDALGVPVVDRQAWQAIAQTYAPVWWIETASPADLIGMPLPGDPPRFDASRAVVYYLPSFTRVGVRVLVQISYLAWFSERPPRGPLDWYSGTLDGIIWRVTLDEAGNPLVYDSIHACGCYHAFFPVAPLPLQANDDYWHEPVALPQTAAAPAGDVALRIGSGAHMLRRVVPASDAPADEVRSYRLAPYADLLSLPSAENGQRSLFDSNGLVAGSERLERWWLWPSGVRSPGAMRQWGRHATAFVGRRHFDDPRLLEQVFRFE